MAQKNVKNSIDVSPRLNAFGIGPSEQRLLSVIGEEIVGEVDWILEPLRPALESMREDGELAAHSDLDKTCEIFTNWMVNRLTQPVDQDWMKAAASVGNWTHENEALPYRVAAVLHHVFARASQLASAGAADKEDREQRMLVLGAVDRMTAELMVARLNRITKLIEAQRRSEIADQFRTTIAALIQKTSRSSAEMGQLASRAKGATQDMVANAVDIAAAAEQSAQVMSNAARESGDLVASIEGTREAVSDIARVSREAAGHAEHAGRVIDTLGRNTKEISSVVDVIRDVADLTRMLALNATIEAAHAGEAGAGFAVVADEVKALATRTETATDEIVRQISEIQASGDQTVSANRAISGHIGEVGKAGANFEATMANQTSQVTTIASMIDETAMTARSMADTVSVVKSNAETVDDQARQVETAFSHINDQLGSLEHAVEAFLRDIAA